jgi:putative transposase
MAKVVHRRVVKPGLRERRSKADSTLILTALGVDLQGHKEVLSLRACAEEDKEGWVCVLEDLRRRGATQIDLIVTDGHDGLLAAVKALFSATLRQCCLLHKQRNVLNAIPRRERAEVAAELAGIWDQPSKGEALAQLAVFKAKYSKRYPEAVHSLAAETETTCQKARARSRININQVSLYKGLGE